MNDDLVNYYLLISSEHAKKEKKMQCDVMKVEEGEYF